MAKSTPRLEEVTAALSKIKIFSALDNKILVQLAKIAKIKEIEEGHYLFLEKQKSSNVFVIISGTIDVEIMLPNEGHLKSIASLKAGDILGELALVGINHRTASAKAMGDVLALQWEVGYLTEYMEQNKEVGFAFMRSLARVLAERMVMTNKELGNVLYQVIYPLNLSQAR